MDVKKKAVSGVKWNTASTVVLTLVQILRLSVLTRLLDKSDFGIIAIATMVIGFTDIFSELGLTVAVIHKQDITDRQYSSVYWTNIILSCVVFFTLWLVSPLVASFYHESILTTIIPLLGIQILLNGFGKMFQTIKVKNLEFVFISLVRIISCLIGFAVTVVMAIMKHGIYSLVVGQLVQVAIMQGIYAFEGRKGQKILWHLNFREIADFIKIGSFRLGSQILDFISSKIDVFLIGRFFGMSDLGVYNLAKDLIVRPYGMINMLTHNVASSAFAQIQTDTNLVKEYYKKVVGFISTISIPVYIVVFLAADLIVRILYGPNFPEVAALLRILSFFGIECAISSQGGIIQVAFGRTDAGFRWTLVRIVSSIFVILVVSSIDIQAVAYGQLLLSVLSVYLFWVLAINPIIKMQFTDYSSAFIRPLILSLCVATPLFLIIVLFKLNIWWQIGAATLYLLLYAMYYWIYQRKYIKWAWSLIANR